MARVIVKKKCKKCGGELRHVEGFGVYGFICKKCKEEFLKPIME